MPTISGILIGTLGICAALCAFAPAFAQSWKPEKTVEMVIGLTAGSSQDRTGRSLQRIWQDKNMLGVTSIVVNRVGGTGQVAWTYLSQHPGDAHYFQIASPTILTGHITGASRFTFADFTPMAFLGSQYVAAAVPVDSPLKSGRDLMERLKRDPYSVSIAINGSGSALHILAGMLVKSAGGDPKKAKIAVFQGAELMTVAIGGHVDCVVTVASNILPHMLSGKLRMLGIASPRRLGGALSPVPAWKEQGVDIVIASWAGVFGVAKMSPQQIAWWDRVLAASVATVEWKTFVEDNAWEAEYLNGADYTRFLRAEDAKFRAALADLGLAKQ